MAHQIPTWGLAQTSTRLSSKITVRKSEIVNVDFSNGKGFIIEDSERAFGYDVIKRFIENKDCWKRVGWHATIDEAVEAIRTGAYNAECRDDIKRVAV